MNFVFQHFHKYITELPNKTFTISIIYLYNHSLFRCFFKELNYKAESNKKKIKVKFQQN